MHGGLTHRLTSRPGPGPAAFAGRRYVARRGAAGLRVLVHHPYGRIARLAPAEEGERAGHAPGEDAFASPHAAAAAILRDVLHRPPEPAACEELARLLAGPAPRVELDEDEVRALAGRIARVA